MAQIVVIDDDQQIRRMLGFILERAGYETDLIGDPKEGLAALKNNKPDLLVLDVMMPLMSGHDVLREIRSDETIADLPVVILSARAQDVDRNTALGMGADAYLSKPIEQDEILSVIGDLLFKGGVSQNASGSRGYVISVFGLRGGIGRTTLAVNLAGALRRVSKEAVCLIDLSPSGGQAAMHFRMAAKPTWQDLATQVDFSPEKIEEYLLQHRSGLYLFAAPVVPQKPDLFSGKQLRGVLNALSNQMTFIVLDLPAIWSDSVMAALECSDMTLHVMTPDLVSVQLGAQTIRTLTNNELQLKQKAHLLNRISPEEGVPATVVEKGIGARLAFQIDYDPNQSRALAQGMPLTLTNAQSPLPAMMRRMADAIWQRIAAKQ